MAATPLDDPERAVGSRNLGSYLYNRYELLRSVEDLERAIKLAEGIVATIALDDPERATGLSNLGLYLYSRYEQLRAIEDFQRVINLAKERIAVIPQIE